MAYISFKPKDYFNTLNYTGTGATGNGVTGAGFTPDMVWLKKITGADGHNLFDTVRGATKYLTPNDNSQQVTGTNTLESFDSDGFTVGLAGTVGQSGYTYAGWCWKAGTTSGISGGTITPSAYSINTTSGVGIYKYTGTGSNGTIAHGLSTAPKMVIVKRLTVDTGDWNSWHKDLGGGTYYINLNTSSAKASNAAVWNSTEPSSTLISIGTYGATNTSGSDYIMYAFSEVKGFSSMGVYTGNGNVDGSFIYTGFEPELIICKNRDSGGVATYGWSMIGNTFGMGGATTANPSYNELTLNAFADTGVQPTTGNAVDFLSNGFKWRSTGNAGNQSTAPFIYIAFARQPIVSSNSKAGTAR
jgi:hypothetical protein|tara:strand:- start:4564 stop:5637 length:1074 start_codon:yes stop_codon:yes gene_type:complete